VVVRRKRGKKKEEREIRGEKKEQARPSH